MAADEDEEEEDVFVAPVEEAQRWEQPEIGVDSGVDDLLTEFTIYLVACGNGTNSVAFKLRKSAFLEALKNPRSVIANEDPDRSRNRWFLADKVTDFCEGWV